MIATTLQPPCFGCQQYYSMYYIRSIFSRPTLSRTQGCSGCFQKTSPSPIRASICSCSSFWLHQSENEIACLSPCVTSGDQISLSPPSSVAHGRTAFSDEHHRIRTSDQVKPDGDSATGCVGSRLSPHERIRATRLGPPVTFGPGPLARGRRDSDPFRSRNCVGRTPGPHSRNQIPPSHEGTRGFVTSAGRTQ